MPYPKLELSHKYYTASQVWPKLGLSKSQFYTRLGRGILPAPTVVDTINYFDHDWVKTARKILNPAR